MADRALKFFSTVNSEFCRFKAATSLFGPEFSLLSENGHPFCSCSIKCNISSSLHINLHQEEEVDFLLRNLPGLQVLNGLVVERDAIFSEDEDCLVNSELLDANASALDSTYQ